MKIGLVSPSVSFHGGGERYPIELCNALKKTKNDLEIDLLSFNIESEEFNGFIRSDVNIINLRAVGSKFNPFPKISSFYKVLRKYDVVHFHQVRSWPAQLGLIMKWFGLLKNVVITDHGGGGKSIEKFLHTSKHADAGAAVSFTSNALTFNFVPWTELVYGGYNSESFFPEEEPMEDKPTVCYIGRVLPYKGLDILAQSVPDGVKLLVVGNVVDRDYFNACKSILEGRNVDYEYLGQLNDAGVRKIFNRSDLHVLPSRRFDQERKFLSSGELFPLSLIEGLACGTPFLSTTSGGPPELAAITRGGYICADGSVEDMAEALQRLLGDREALRRVGSHGAQTVQKKFSWTAVAERTLNVYNTVYQEATL